MLYFILLRISWAVFIITRIQKTKTFFLSYTNGNTEKLKSQKQNLIFASPSQQKRCFNVQ